MEDEKTQKRGAVVIGYNLGGVAHSGAELAALRRIDAATPGRIASLHACVDDAVTKTLMTVCVILMGDHASTRYRCHSGSHMEIQYALNTFGIPNRLLPVTATGDIDVNEHQNFLRQLRIQEDSLLANSLMDTSASSISSAVRTGEIHPSDGPGIFHAGNGREEEALSWNHIETTHPSMNVMTAGVNSSSFTSFEEEQLLAAEPQASDHGTDFVVVPGEQDVLLGRGKLVLEHIGNIRYRHTLCTYKDRYEKGSKMAKSEILDEIVQRIYKSGGRFLEQNHDGGCWVPVSYDTARQKVSHYFRNQKRIDIKRAERAGRKTRPEKSTWNSLSSKDVTRERLRDDCSDNSNSSRLSSSSPESTAAASSVLSNDVTDGQGFDGFAHYNHQVKRRRSSMMIENEHPFNDSMFDLGAYHSTCTFDH
jgi:hypothetical protein